MTELIIGYVRDNWWILLFIICMTSYFVYSMIDRRRGLKKLEDRKKMHENELAALEAKFGEKAKQLEEKLNERKKFLKKG